MAEVVLQRDYSYFIRGTKFFRGCFKLSEGTGLPRCGDVFFAILISKKQTEFCGRLSLCFNTFRSFNRSVNKKQMSPAQTVFNLRISQGLNHSVCLTLSEISQTDIVSKDSIKIWKSLAVVVYDLSSTENLTISSFCLCEERHAKK